jgi:hypothetical protein
MNIADQQVLNQQTVFRFDRLDALEGWWVGALALTVLVLGVIWIIHLYRRDTRELPRWLAASMLMLRLSLWGLLFLFFLQLERRSQQRVGRASEAVVLVDSSQSMSLAADDSPASESRIERVDRIIRDPSWLTGLTKQHRVSVYGTSTTATNEPIELISLKETTFIGAASRQQQVGVDPAQMASTWMALTVFMAGLILMGIAVSRAWQAGVVPAERFLFFGTALLLIGGVGLSTVFAIGAGNSISSLFLGGDEARITEEVATVEESSVAPLEAISKLEPLKANGPQSRIGDALQWISRKHDPATLAGVFLFSDGQNTSGLSLDAVGRAYQRLGTSIFPIGVGSPRPPVNVRIVDLESPPRVYPGDQFEVSATLQAVGATGEVEVQLLDGLDTDPWQGTIVDTKRVVPNPDGAAFEVPFELEPETAGKRQLAVRVVPLSGEQNTEDNQLVARYEVIARRLRVLVVAGGPSREYQFVRNLLHRDREVTLDVWLQSGQTGMSQEANELLTEFPTTAEALFAYDSLIAFDPNWDLLNVAQVELLDRWVAEQAGGLIYIAGPVFTPRLGAGKTEQKRKIRSLLPVVLESRSINLDQGRNAGESPLTLQWTEDGKRAQFLQPADVPEQSARIWDQFSGFFAYCAVREPKPGASVFSRIADDAAVVDGNFPVMMASQFFGAGRTFFMGSGELWRLRSEGDAYFDRVYTKLTRWSAEGRLLRDSNRGVLIIDPPKAIVGDTISIRAVLLDEQLVPLEVPEVEAQIFEPGRGFRPFLLRRLEGQPRGGTYGGQFTARLSGQYEIRIELGDITNRAVLRGNVHVRLPTLEMERPRRNDADMLLLASQSTGKYLTLDEPQSGGSNFTELVRQFAEENLLPRPQEVVLPGTPDRDFQRRRNAGLLACFSGAWILEWLLRRLNRLA